MPPKALILSGYGFNTENETKFCFDHVGADSYIIHINDLISGDKKLDDYQMLFISGGFSYGDHTGAGKGMANKILNNLQDEVLSFVQKDTLTLGVCNGFQVLTALGLAPALDKSYGERQCALLKNDSNRYQCHWTNLKIKSDKCVFTKEMDTLYCPIAHGEGNFYAEDAILDQIEANDQVAFTYTENPSDPLLPTNPNGASRDIAGICDGSGRVMGMMPHPERAIWFHQRPDFGKLKEEYLRAGKDLPVFGDGIKIFENMTHYFK